MHKWFTEIYAMLVPDGVVVSQHLLEHHSESLTRLHQFPSCQFSWRSTKANHVAKNS